MKKIFFILNIVLCFCFATISNISESAEQRFTYAGYLHSNDAGIFLSDIKIPKNIYDKEIKAYCQINSACVIDLSSIEIDGEMDVEKVATKIFNVAKGQILEDNIKINKINMPESGEFCSIKGIVNNKEIELFGEFFKIENLKINKSYKIKYTNTKSINKNGSKDNYFYLIEIKD